MQYVIVKIKFFKEQQSKRLLSSLAGIKTSLSQIPLLGLILF